jgi:peroxiredoxin
MRSHATAGRLFRRMHAVPLIILLAISVASAAQESVSLDDGPFSPPGVKKDKPVLVSITVTPKPLDRNKINSIKIKISFKDDGQNLQGGTLEMQICDETSCSDSTINLNAQKYARRKGKNRIKTSISVGDTDWIEIKAWLRDSGGLLSTPKKLEVAVSKPTDNGGDDGPPWGTKLGERAIDFTLKDQNGRSVSLHDYWGSVILVDFSPQWCGPCQEEAAEAEQLYQVHKNSGFVILTVLFQDYQRNPITQDKCKAWAETYGLTFPVLADVEETVYHTFAENNNVPLNIIIDRKMEIRYKVHYYSKEELEAKVAELVAEAPEVVKDER